jgi:hypothetical protein
MMQNNYQETVDYSNHQIEIYLTNQGTYRYKIFRGDGGLMVLRNGIDQRYYSNTFQLRDEAIAAAKELINQKGEKES